jgi:hypothetical protein
VDITQTVRHARTRLSPSTTVRDFKPASEPYRMANPSSLLSVQICSFSIRFIHVRAGISGEIKNFKISKSH